MCSAYGGLVCCKLELFAYDQGLRWRRYPPDGRIVLISETENDIQRWGYPISDGVLADVLDHLTQGRPRVIGVDKYRDHPRALPPGSDHERLNQLLRHHPEIVWVTKFGNSTPQDPFIAPPSVLEVPTKSVSAIFLRTRTV
ncbi:MAG: CHASE2 domain-containing protein [Candidatus Competibacteraceae bacterium]